MRTVGALLGFCLCTAVTAQGQALLLPVDSTHLDVRSPSPEVLQRVLSDPDFRYEDPVPERASIVDWLRYWWRRIMRPVLDSPIMDPIWRIILWTIAGATLAYVVGKLMGSDLRGVLQRKSREMSFELTDAEVHGLDFDRMIEAAVEKGRYRQAVRLQYLKLLRQLSDRELIRWTRDKTNRTYVREFRDWELRPAFANITNTYNVCWYGEARVSASQYDAIRTSIDELSAAVARRDDAPEEV